MIPLKKIASILFILLNTIVFSQNHVEKTENPFWKNVHFGGGIQLNIGSSYTNIGISPSAIYEFSDKIATGVGVSYMYVNYSAQDVRYNILGVNALLLYNPIKEIQLSTEFEELNIHEKRSDIKSDYWNPALYLGVAYAMNKHVAMGMRYDLLYDPEKSIYDRAFTPFVRVYF